MHVRLFATDATCAEHSEIIAGSGAKLLSRRVNGWMDRVVSLAVEWYLHPNWRNVKFCSCSRLFGTCGSETAHQRRCAFDAVVCKISYHGH
jgi:hypothetical protein